MNAKLERKIMGLIEGPHSEATLARAAELYEQKEAILAQVPQRSEAKKRTLIQSGTYFVLTLMFLAVTAVAITNGFALFLIIISIAFSAWLAGASFLFLSASLATDALFWQAFLAYAKVVPEANISQAVLVEFVPHFEAAQVKYE